MVSIFNRVLVDDEMNQVDAGFACAATTGCAILSLQIHSDLIRLSSLRNPASLFCCFDVPLFGKVTGIMIGKVSLRALNAGV